jgi:type I restriction enzyme S subunit
MEVVLENIQIEKYSAYKDSGVEWLGHIPAHWTVTTLSKSLSPVTKKNKPGLPLLSITREKGVILRDLDNEEENHNFIPDDLSNYKVLESGQFGMNKMKAWQGSYGISPHTGIVSPAYFVFKLLGNFHDRYFHLAIRSKLFVDYFGSASDGVRIGQWDLSKNRMKRIPFLVPPLEEQAAIAQFLDRKTSLIDKAIAIKEKQIELLKERRQILIHKAVTRGLDPNVKLKDSGVEWIGEIPEHWDVARIKHCSFKISKGTTPSTEGGRILDEGPIRYIKAENIQNGLITDAPAHFIDNKTNALIRRSELHENDVLFVIAGATLGKVAIVSQDHIPSNTNQAVAFIRPDEKVKAPYLAIWLASSIVQEITWLDAVQSAQPNLSMENLGNFPILIPESSEQSLILDKIKDCSENIEIALSLKETEIEKLKEYKSSLINSAVTGKIKVC